MGDDPPGVGVAGRAGLSGERCRRCRGRRGGCCRRAPSGSDAGPQVLAAKGAALGGRGSLGPADAGRWVPAGIDRIAALPVVREAEAGPVPGADIERAVGAEPEAADRVARVLLAPGVLDQHLLGTGHDVAQRLEPREPAADHAAVVGRPRRVRAAVGGHARRAPAREVVGVGQIEVVCVEDVHVRLGGEVGVEREAQEAAVPEVVDLGSQVGEHGRRRVVEVVEDLDQAALLGNEHAPVAGELDRRRLGQSGEDDLLLEALGELARLSRHR